MKSEKATGYRVTKVLTTHRTLGVEESKWSNIATGNVGLIYTLDCNGLCTRQSDGVSQKAVIEQFKECNSLG